MRRENESLPSLEESKFETEKRLRIIKELEPKLREFSEVVIVAGSVAYGKNYSVRNESDIDLIILINRKDIFEVLSSGLFEVTSQVKEAREFFESSRVDHFSIVEDVEGVEVQFHFWDKEAHFKAEVEDYVPRVYDVWCRSEPKIRGRDFLGNERIKELEVYEVGEYGCIHDFPASFIYEGKFVPCQVILNLITDPIILFCKDERLYENIEEIWKVLVDRLKLEGEGEIMNSIYGNWNISIESKKKIERKIREVHSTMRIPGTEDFHS